MSGITLRVNDNYIEDFELNDVSISYNLKDFKNPSERNLSYTKKIKVLQTENSDKVFGSLYNINSYGGYDLRKKVNAELVENDITLLRGHMFLESIDKNYYYVYLTSNDIDIFKSVGDRLIEELDFGTTNQHVLNKQYILTQYNNNLNLTGKGIYYNIIDYDNSIFSNVDLAQDIQLTPSVCALEIFEKILIDNGYNYTISNDLLNEFKRLVIPYNNDFSVTSGTDYTFAKCHFIAIDSIPSGNPHLLLEATPDNEDLHKARFFKHTGDYNNFQNSFGYTIENPDGGFLTFYSTGKYRLKLEIRYNNWDFELAVGEDQTKEIDLRFYNNELNIIELGNCEIEGTEPTYDQYNNRTDTYKTLNVEFDFDVLPENLNRKWYVSFLKEGHIKIAPETFVELETMNYTYNNLTVNMQDVLPKAYKQKDFMKDLLNMFNVYVQSDKYNSKLIHLRTYEEFYSDEILDWSEKVDSNTLSFKDLSNVLKKELIYSYEDDVDLFNKDYKDLYSKALYTKSVVSPSEITKDTETIKLTVVPTVVTKFQDYFLPRIVTKDKAKLKNRILYQNQFTFATPLFVSGAAGNYFSVSKILTCTPFRTSDVTSATNFHLAFDSTESYLDTITITNNNLYNKYHKHDIEASFNAEYKVVEAEFNLNAFDISEDIFRKLIFISDPDFGDFYCRLNSIKDYSPNFEFCKVELIKINNYKVSYTSTIPHIIIPTPFEKIREFKEKK